MHTKLCRPFLGSNPPPLIEPESGWSIFSAGANDVPESRIYIIDLT